MSLKFLKYYGGVSWIMYGSNFIGCLLKYMIDHVMMLCIVDIMITCGFKLHRIAGLDVLSWNKAQNLSGTPKINEHNITRNYLKHHVALFLF